MHEEMAHLPVRSDKKENNRWESADVTHNTERPMLSYYCSEMFHIDHLRIKLMMERTTWNYRGIRKTPFRGTLIFSYKNSGQI